MHKLSFWQFYSYQITRILINPSQLTRLQKWINMYVINDSFKQAIYHGIQTSTEHKDRTNLKDNDDLHQRVWL